MAYVRQSVYANGGTFGDPIIHWYAIGVQELMDRQLADKTSWGFMSMMLSLYTAVK